jgi:hypothetical protein
VTPRAELRGGASLGAAALATHPGGEHPLAEIARSHLFEWHGIPAEGRRTALAFAAWLDEQRDTLGDLGVDPGAERFLTCYPFHPALLAVLERAPHREGIPHLLARWVVRAYADGQRGAQKDSLIGLGSAPLEDPAFRAALFEGLSNPDLEAAVAADIAGAASHAARLDRQAPEELRVARLHRKVAAAIFFHSSNGQGGTGATMPEIAVAVGEPGLDLAQVKTALDALTGTCYYLTDDGGRYCFSAGPNLNKLLAERRAAIEAQAVDAGARAAIHQIFMAGPAWAERAIFPTASQDIPDRPAPVLVVLGPDQCRSGPARTATLAFVDRLLGEHGASGRVFRNALFVVAPGATTDLYDAARTLLAWEEIAREETIGRMDEGHRRQIESATEAAQLDLQERIRAAYRWVLLLGAENALTELDIGVAHGGAGAFLGEQIRDRLLAAGAIAEIIDPSILIRNWPPFREWSMRAVRDAFYANPALRRPLDAGSILRTIAQGVAEGLLGYIVRDDEEGQPVQVRVDTALAPEEVRFGDDTMIVRAADARALGATPGAGRPREQPAPPPRSLRWEGVVPWASYDRLGSEVLARFAGRPGFAIRVRFEVPAEGLADEEAQQVRAALRALGLDEGGSR